MAIELIQFDRDEAVQELLGHAGVDGPYEDVIRCVSLGILRQSVPNCQIESIRFVRPPSNHPGMCAGGMPIEDNATKIRLQDMTIPFDLEILVLSDDTKQRLEATFTFECRKMDDEPENEFRLDIRGQSGA